MSVRQKLDIVLENKVVQKLKLKKLNLISSNKKKSYKIRQVFFHWKLTFKVQFWHFLMNHYSLYSQNTMLSFEYVEFWPKFLLFITHHLWNSRTELTYGTAVASGGAVGVRQTFDATAGLQDVVHGHFQPGSQVPARTNKL